MSTASQMFRRSDLFKRCFRVCSNASCRKPHIVSPAWLCKVEGVKLQGRWYCSDACFESSAREVFAQLLPPPMDTTRKAHRIPMGLLLLSRGIINDSQLKQALLMQREQGNGRIGKFLRQIEAVTDNDIAVGLAAQWGCPVYPLDQAREFLQCAPLLPLALVEDRLMLPVHHARAQQLLYIAFVGGVDRTSLYAVEQMLQMRTVPCIVPESALKKALDELRHVVEAPAAIFESPSEISEMARTTLSYAQQVSATDVWMARSGKYIWVRLHCGQTYKDILFQAGSGHQSPG